MLTSKAFDKSHPYRAEMAFSIQRQSQKVRVSKESSLNLDQFSILAAYTKGYVLI